MQETNEQRECYVVAVFDDRYAAEQAVDDLKQAGFDHQRVGFAIRGDDAVAGGMITDAVGTKDGRGAVTGLIAGGALGGMLGAAAALMVPGVGPILSAGILMTALGGAAAGAATGGILGAMAGLGISEDEARFFETELRSGKAIVTVKAGAQREEAIEILRRHGGRDIAASAMMIPTIEKQTDSNSHQTW